MRTFLYRSHVTLRFISSNLFLSIWPCKRSPKSILWTISRPLCWGSYSRKKTVVPRFEPKIGTFLRRSHVTLRFISSNLPCSMWLCKRSPKSRLCAISRSLQGKLFKKKPFLPSFKPKIGTFHCRSHVKLWFISSNLFLSMRLFQFDYGSASGFPSFPRAPFLRRPLGPFSLHFPCINRRKVHGAWLLNIRYLPVLK